MYRSTNFVFNHNRCDFICSKKTTVSIWNPWLLKPRTLRTICNTNLCTNFISFNLKFSFSIIHIVFALCWTQRNTKKVTRTKAGDKRICECKSGAIWRINKWYPPIQNPLMFLSRKVESHCKFISHLQFALQCLSKKLVFKTDMNQIFQMRYYEALQIKGLQSYKLSKLGKNGDGPRASIEHSDFS